MIDDATEEDWLYPHNTFDYIHTRVMLGSFEDFREVINKAFKYTKPGGWMESQVRLAMSCYSPCPLTELLCSSSALGFYEYRILR